MGLARGGGATVTKTANAVDTTNATSYSFASQSLGTPSADRYLVVVAHGISNSGSRSIGTITVAGAATTELISIQGTGGNTTDVKIAITNAVNSVDSTGTVVVGTTGSVQFSNMGIVVYAVTRLNSNAADGTPQTTNTDNAVMSLPISAGGVAIGGCVYTSAGFAWTALTEDVDQTIEAGTCGGGAASVTSATAQTLSVQCDTTDSTNFAAVCVALR